MKRFFYLSAVCASALFAAEAELQTIDVEAKAYTEIVKDVHAEEIKSADVAEALHKQSSSILLKRRSGISNDIAIRGQVKDNIAVTIDGAKVCGACPNRMDPPISHILANNIDYIEILQGPYDVENFGVLSAGVYIHTIMPEKEAHGDLNLNIGSWGYHKGSFSVSGGITDNVRFLLSGSTEKGGQYEDGNGNDFVGQIDKNIKAGTAMKGNQYKTKYQDLDAFSKDTIMAKLFWEIADNQELRLSYTGNRSDDILYPSSPMDALYDDSDIYDAEYIAKDLGKYSKELTAQIYRSEVEHPMSTVYRNSSTTEGKPTEMTHELNTKMQGAKIKNSFDMDNHTITEGVDYSLRNWDGGYYQNGTPLPPAMFASINDVDTENRALFAKDKIAMDKLTLDLGARYDDTVITSSDPRQQENDYNEFGAYLLGSYQMDSDTKCFAGVGRSSRVPDAKELYFRNKAGIEVGTPDLEAVINNEIDIGAEKQFGSSSVKAKMFYSMYEDFIAYNTSNVNAKGAAYHAYENVDATVYGFELSGSYFVTDALSIDGGISYQRGEKDHPLTNQTGTDLPDIPPLMFTGAVNYDYDDTLNLRAELIGADEWSHFDWENGEQELDSYMTLNLKATKTLYSNFEVTLGVDNLLDEAYAVSNTYSELTLLAGGDGDVMLLNEPGRYFYTNLRYKF
jgi:iron complex outermembrane receptor protein